MGSLRVDQVNVVMGDADAACHFLADLGVDIEGAPADWTSHHRAVPVADAPFGVDFDSSAFAAHWGGLPPSFAGVVVNLRVEVRSDVDVLHERALELGARSLKDPYDAFWGSRFAVVEGPGPVVVGLKSPPEASRRTPGPDPSSFR